MCNILWDKKNIFVWHSENICYFDNIKNTGQIIQYESGFQQQLISRSSDMLGYNGDVSELDDGLGVAGKH